MKLVYFFAQFIGAFQWLDLFLKKMDLKFLVSETSWLNLYCYFKQSFILAKIYQSMTSYHCIQRTQEIYVYQKSYSRMRNLKSICLPEQLSQMYFCQVFPYHYINELYQSTKIGFFMFDKAPHTTKISSICGIIDIGSSPLMIRKLFNLQITCSTRILNLAIRLVFATST